MKRLAAQYIITNSGPALKRAVITVDDDGTILSVEEKPGDLKETHSTEFHNGIIIPGFVNCSCHPGLSLMKDRTLKVNRPGGFIENRFPPLKMLIEEDCEIVIETNNQVSDTNQSILEEIKRLQLNYPDLHIEELLALATINGAKALGKEELYGKIEPGKRPGLLLLENIDLQNMKLLPESTVKRLI